METQTLKERLAAVESSHQKLSIRRRCELLDLNCNGFYYKPKAESDESLRIMKIKRNWSTNALPGMEPQK